MQNYIVCEKRGSMPRIHVKICQNKCEYSDQCDSFQRYLKRITLEQVVIGSSSADLSSEKLVPIPKTHQ